LLTDQILLEIVERASSLTERLNGVFLPITELSPQDLVETRLAEWRKATGDTQAGWENRLAWSNFQPEILKAALGTVQLADREQLPGWATTLREVLCQAQAPNPLEEMPGFLDPTDPVPFEELLAPFVRWARHQLKAQQPFRPELFTNEAENNLERYLIAILARLSANTFQTEFKVFCTRRQISRLFQPLMPTNPDGKPGNQLYLGFVKQIQQDNYTTFFREYSVLARLMVRATQYWIEAIAEIGERLRHDLPAIRQELFARQELGLVTRAESGLSDPHRNGRSVIKLKFTSGLKLIYKPKDLGLEQAYNEMLGWLNETGELLSFKAIKIIARPGYGWAEFVEQLPCADRAALARFYRRFGMLLGLIHLLNGTDCHYENLIASGESPVLIDAETLLHPLVPYVVTETGEEAAKLELMVQNLENSILRTAMLPILSAEAAELDFSAFSAIEAQNTNYNLPHWEYINTDRMNLFYEKARIEPGQNAPLLEGVNINLAEHANDFCGGFEEIYRFFINRREVLMSEESPLRRFTGQTGRFLFRNTRVYGLLLHHASQPAFMREGIDRSLHFEKLSRGFLAEGTRPVYWPLLEQERQDLEQLDIPLLECNTANRKLFLVAGTAINDWFSSSGEQAVYSRLQALDETDLCRQQATIREAMRSRFAGEAFNFEKVLV
jgi:type 2 lantibiotic biosynthesis protein LanM